MSKDDKQDNVVSLFPNREPEQKVQTSDDRHYAAMMKPKDWEVPIVLMFNGLMQYPKTYAEAFGSHLADDAVFEEPWKKMAYNFIQLLNGEVGRLDAGKLEAGLRAMAASHSITLE